MARRGGTAPGGVGVPVGIGVGVPVGPVTVCSVTTTSPGPGVPGSKSELGVSVAVGISGRTARGSMPGGTMITPGLPSAGGVTITSVCTMTGVGVKVGTKAAACWAVGVARRRCTRSAAEHPRISIRKTPTMIPRRAVLSASGGRA